MTTLGHRRQPSALSEKPVKAFFAVPMIQRVRRALGKKSAAKASKNDRSEHTKSTSSTDSKPGEHHVEVSSHSITLVPSEEALRASRESSVEEAVKPEHQTQESTSAKQEYPEGFPLPQSAATFPLPPIAPAFSSDRPTSSKSWRRPFKGSLDTGSHQIARPTTQSDAPLTPETPVTARTTDTTDMSFVTPATSRGAESNPDVDSHTLMKSQTVDSAPAPSGIRHRVSIFRRHTLSAKKSKAQQPPLPMKMEPTIPELKPEPPANLPLRIPPQPVFVYPVGENSSAASSKNALGLRREEIQDYDYCL